MWLFVVGQRQVFTLATTKSNSRAILGFNTRASVPVALQLCPPSQGLTPESTPRPTPGAPGSTLANTVAASILDDCCDGVSMMGQQLSGPTTPTSTKGDTYSLASRKYDSRVRVQVREQNPSPLSSPCTSQAAASPVSKLDHEALEVAGESMQLLPKQPVNQPITKAFASQRKGKQEGELEDLIADLNPRSGFLVRETPALSPSSIAPTQQQLLTFPLSPVLPLELVGESQSLSEYDDPRIAQQSCSKQHSSHFTPSETRRSPLAALKALSVSSNAKTPLDEFDQVGPRSQEWSLDRASGQVDDSIVNQLLRQSLGSNPDRSLPEGKHSYGCKSTSGGQEDNTMSLPEVFQAESHSQENSKGNGFGIVADSYVDQLLGQPPSGYNGSTIPQDGIIEGQLVNGVKGPQASTNSDADIVKPVVDPTAANQRQLLALGSYFAGIDAGGNNCGKVSSDEGSQQQQHAVCQGPASPRRQPPPVLAVDNGSGPQLSNAQQVETRPKLSPLGLEDRSPSIESNSTATTFPELPLEMMSNQLQPTQIPGQHIEVPGMAAQKLSASPRLSQAGHDLVSPLQVPVQQSQVDDAGGQGDDRGSGTSAIVPVLSTDPYLPVVESVQVPTTNSPKLAQVSVDPPGQSRQCGHPVQSPPSEDWLSVSWLASVSPRRRPGAEACGKEAGGTSLVPENTTLPVAACRQQSWQEACLAGDLPPLILLDDDCYSTAGHDCDAAVPACTFVEQASPACKVQPIQQDPYDLLTGASQSPDVRTAAGQPSAGRHGPGQLDCVVDQRQCQEDLAASIAWSSSRPQHQHQSTVPQVIPSPLDPSVLGAPVHGAQPRAQPSEQARVLPPLCLYQIGQRQNHWTNNGLQNTLKRDLPPPAHAERVVGNFRNRNVHIPTGAAGQGALPGDRISQHAKALLEKYNAARYGSAKACADCQEETRQPPRSVSGLGGETRRQAEIRSPTYSSRISDVVGEGPQIAAAYQVVEAQPLAAFDPEERHNISPGTLSQAYGTELCQPCAQSQARALASYERVEPMQGAQGGAFRERPRMDAETVRMLRIQQFSRHERKLPY